MEGKETVELATGELPTGKGPARSTSPSTPPRWGVVGVLSAGHFFNDFYAVYLAALLPTLTTRFDLSGSAKGLLASVFAVSASLSQPLMGWLGDRVRRRAVIVLGMAAAAVLLSLLSEAQSVWLVGLLLIGGGLGVSVYHPNSGVLVRHASGGRALAMAVFVSGGALGIFVSPMVVRWCADEGHLSALPWSMAAGLGVAVVIAVTPFSPPGRPAHLPRLRGLLQRAHAPLYVLLAVGVLRALTYLTFSNFLLFHVQAQEWAAAHGRLLLGAFLLSAAVGGLMGGLLADRVGRRRVIVFSCLVGGGVLVVSPQAGPGATAAGLILGGLALGAATPVCVVMAQELAPAHASTATGVMTGFAWGVGGLLLPAIGAIEDAASPALALRVGAAATALAGFLALALTEPRREVKPIDLVAELPPE